MAALAYLPIKTPALKLLVAKSALTTLFGVVGESSAITSTPAFLAFVIAGFSAFASEGVIRIPLTPAVTMFSIAVISPALSEVLLPAAVMSCAPSFFACAVAPCRILTKKGLSSVLVISPTLIAALFEAVPAEATATAVAAASRAAARSRRSGRLVRRMSSPFRG